ncbi:DUF1963 domain-containing protein [Verrucomicrobiaceae bacterium 227]
MLKSSSIPASLRPFVKKAIGMKEEEGGFRSSTGGLPARELDFEWPQFQDRSLSLLATIYLSELPGIHDWLPSEGILLFFYDFETEPWGDDSEDYEGWKVVWLKEEPVSREFCEKPSNLDAGYIIKQRPLSFQEVVTLPFEDHPLFEEVEISEDDREAWEERFDDDEQWEEFDTGHIGGYSDAANGALYAFGCRTLIDGGDPDRAYQVSLEEVQEVESGMCLLFEYEMEERDGDEAPEIHSGRNFSFWAKMEDLLRHDFSKAWLRVERD